MPVICKLWPPQQGKLEMGHGQAQEESFARLYAPGDGSMGL